MLIKLIIAVSDTERATSPFANFVKIFDYDEIKYQYDLSTQLIIK